MVSWGDEPPARVSVRCPRKCGERIHGTERDIDSGVRKHLDNYCPVKDPDDTKTETETE